MSESQHHTLVCSVLFLDIEGYSKRSVTEQLSIKQQFNALLVAALRHVATDDRIILDTGDGAAVSFLSDPEDSLFAAMNLRDAIAATAPTLRVRIGINLGPVRLLKDINGQVNIIGDGINDAQRVMSFCEPGKILVSRSYYEVVSRLSDDYAHLFVYEGTHADKHVREHAVYAIGASTPEPPHDFTARIEAGQTPLQNTPIQTPSLDTPRAAAPTPDAPRQGGRKWIAIAVVAMLMIFGSAALWLWRGKAPQEAPTSPPEKPAEQTTPTKSIPEPTTAPPPGKSVERKDVPVERKVAPAAGTQAPKPTKTKKEAESPSIQKEAESSPAQKEDVSTPRWLVEMRNELSVCRKQGLLQRGICFERVRWKYCQPSHWDKVEECLVSKGGN